MYYDIHDIIPDSVCSRRDARLTFHVGESTALPLLTRWARYLLGHIATHEARMRIHAVIAIAKSTQICGEAYNSADKPVEARKVFDMYNPNSAVRTLAVPKRNPMFVLIGCDMVAAGVDISEEHVLISALPVHPLVVPMPIGVRICLPGHQD